VLANRKKRPQRRISISVPDSMARKIETLARDRDQSTSDVVRDTLRFLGIKPGELVRAPSMEAISRGEQSVVDSRRLPRAIKRPLAGLEDSTVPGRITVNVTGKMAELVNAVSMRDDVSKNSIVLSALEQTLGRAVANLGTGIVIQNREELISYSRILIDALQEALDYDTLRQHNRPPPDLRLDDNEYLNELRKLVAELQKLNVLLEAMKPARAKTAATKVGKHFDKFFESYASALGKGAAGLTIGAVAVLLAKAGVAQPLIDAIWRHLDSKE
jgi:Arc/MetJ-type ribon-helix-helix transcriptional regulator